MRRVCCVCKIIYGFKKPLEDESETHGFCPNCLELELAKIANYKINGGDPYPQEDPTS